MKRIILNRGMEIKRLFIVLLVIIMSSCTTSLPEPTTQHQTILVIPLSAENKSERSFEYSLSLEISKDTESGTYLETAYSGEITPKEDVPHIIIPDLPPGHYVLTKVIKFKTGLSSATGHEEERVLNQPFLLKKGEISILSKALRMVQQRSSNNESSFYFTFRNIPFYEKDRLLQDLKKEKSFNKWKLNGT